MTVHFRDRAALHMAQPIRSQMTHRNDGDVVGITLHDTGAQTAYAATKWLQIQREAMNGTLPSGDHYADTPYNAGITLDGEIYEGRDASYVGAHALSPGNVANRTTLGIAVIGDGTTLTRAAQDAIRAAMFLFAHRFGRQPFMFDHRDFNDRHGSRTGCPGEAVVAFTLQLRAEQRRAHG